MQAMQYKVGLPADYDMEIIKKEFELAVIKRMDLKIYYSKPI